MDIAEREFQQLAEMELASLTVHSVCVNSRFGKLICPDARILSRYLFFYESLDQGEIEKGKRAIRNKLASQKDTQVLFFIFSYPNDTRRPNDSVLSMAGEHVTVIDATGVRMDQAVNERFARDMAYYNLACAGHDPDAEVWRDRAYDELRAWTERVLSSPVKVYDSRHPEGRTYDTLALFYDKLLKETFEIYPLAPDTMDLDGYFFRTLGARLLAADGYYGQRLTPWETEDDERTPDRLFRFVWGDDSAWYDPAYADEKTVILKKACDAYISGRLEKGERISFKEIFEYLRQPPYGLLPNYIGAILMGMFFRTWKDKGLIWTNGFQQDVLDDARLLAMIENGIHNQRTYYKNSLVDYIMLPDPRITALCSAAEEIFGLDRTSPRFLPDLRSGLRAAMEALPYPVISAQYAADSDAVKEALGRLIRLVRLTSDNEDKAYEEELIDALSTAFREDPGLAWKIRECLYGDALREGFERMLKKNGIDPGSVTEEVLSHISPGHSDWKWIWQEETVIERIPAVR